MLPSTCSLSTFFIPRYRLRADIGSGIHYMLGSWYTPREIGKRAMVFWLAGSIGQMFSGFLQAAAVSDSEFQHLSLRVYFAFQSALVRTVYQ